MDIKSIKVSGLYKTNNDYKINNYINITSSIEKENIDNWCLTFPSNKKIYLNIDDFKKILKKAVSNNFYEWTKDIFSNKPLFSFDFNFFKNLLINNNLGMELVDSLMLIAYKLLDAKDDFNYLDLGFVLFDEIKQKNGDKNRIIIPKKEIQVLVLSDKSFFKKLKEVQWFFECKIFFDNNGEYKFIYRPFNTIPLYDNYDEMDNKEKNIIFQIQEEYKRLLKDFE